MNRNDFLNMIEEKGPLNRQIISEINELIDIFPYFQSAHLLLLKGLQDNSDVKFESQLRNSAIHVADREVLYYYLKTKIPPKDKTDENKPGKTSTEDLVYDTQQTVIESAKNSEYLINEIEKNSGETELNQQQDIINRASGHSILISTEPDNEESSGVMFLLDEDASDNEDKIFYMDPGFSAPDRSDLLELDLDENATKKPDETVIVFEKPDIEETTSKKQFQSELIDKFIIANPRIEPNKEKTDVPGEDISKPFVEQEGGLITETLARIYVNQGYYSKAIDIYEKLSLKFPEKNSYFASQIEKVKEYIKK